MSQNHTGLQLRNTGTSACTLYGYPGVSWVRGASGVQTGAAATRQADPNGTEKIVTLAPGALASAPLDIVDAAVIPPSECKPVAVRGLRIYPPGQQAALFLPLPTAAGGYGECSLTTKSPTLMIGYLEAGAQPGGGAQGYASSPQPTTGGPPRQPVSPYPRARIPRPRWVPWATSSTLQHPLTPTNQPRRYRRCARAPVPVSQTKQDSSTRPGVES